MESRAVFPITVVKRRYRKLLFRRVQRPLLSAFPPPTSARDRFARGECRVKKRRARHLVELLNELQALYNVLPLEYC